MLSELRSLDIRVRWDGDQLRCDAPAGVVTADLRDAIRQRKAEITEFLRAAEALSRQQRAIVPLQPRGERDPVFAVGGHNGDVFCYRALAAHLGEDQPVFRAAAARPRWAQRAARGRDGSGRVLCRTDSSLPAPRSGRDRGLLRGRRDCVRAGATTRAGRHTSQRVSRCLVAPIQAGTGSCRNSDIAWRDSGSASASMAVRWPR